MTTPDVVHATNLLAERVAGRVDESARRMVERYRREIVEYATLDPNDLLEALITGQPARNRRCAPT